MLIIVAETTFHNELFYHNNISFSCRAFNAPYYIGMIVPFLVIYIFNFIVFGLVFVSLLRKTYLSKQKNVTKATDKNSNISFLRQQLVIVFTLSVLFGLGWAIGLLATQDAHNNKHVRNMFSALFVLITAFHGLFIFIMNGVRSKDVQTVWKQWFQLVTRKEFDNTTFSTTSVFRHRNVTSTTNPAYSSRHISGEGTLQRGSTSENPYESGTLKYFTSKKNRNNGDDHQHEDIEWEKEHAKEREAMADQVEPVYEDMEMQRRAKKEKRNEEMKESGMH